MMSEPTYPVTFAETLQSEFNVESIDLLRDRIEEYDTTVRSVEVLHAQRNELIRQISTMSNELRTQRIWLQATQGYVEYERHVNLDKMKRTTAQTSSESWDTVQFIANMKTRMPLSARLGDYHSLKRMAKLAMNNDQREVAQSSQMFRNMYVSCGCASHFLKLDNVSIDH